MAPGNLAGYGDPFFNSNYEIISAEIGLSTSNGAGGAGNVDRSTTTHELGHALGRAHSTAPSVMGGGGTGTCLPTLNDRMYGEYHYRRPPGTRSPDDTTHVETIRGRVSSIPMRQTATPRTPVLMKFSRKSSNTDKIASLAASDEFSNRPAVSIKRESDSIGSPTSSRDRRSRFYERVP